MLNPQISNSQVSNVSQSKSVDHPNCSSRIGLDCYMAAQIEITGDHFFFLISSGCSFHFAALRNSLISLALGPPASSVPGVATERASISPKAFMARETCCRPARRRKVKVLPKKLILHFVSVFEGRGRLRCLWRGLSQCLRDLGLPCESDFEGRVCFLLPTVFASRLRVGGVSRCSLSTQRD